MRTFAASPPRWLEVRTANAAAINLRLGPGEREAIALALELAASTLLVDDRDARATAQQSGLFVTGTLGVLEAAAAADLIQLEVAFERLCRTSFRMSPAQVQAALARDAARKHREP
ncbi:MAG: hypothetical protein KF699_02975 [Phycisphaeraceae bacterium]|nr:hypothetical protein [Phycisphaeraceae bacterium]